MWFFKNKKCKQVQKIENLKEILKYIPYFESDKSKYTIVVPRDEGGDMLSAAYFLYDETLEEFLGAIHKLNIIDDEYLYNHGKIESKYSDKDETDIIKLASLEEIFTIVTFYIRGERFCTGMIAEACDKKIFLEILKRIKCLIESSKT